MERPLHASTTKSIIANIALESGDAEIDTAVLYSQIVIDKAQLARHIRHALQERSQITLRELCESQPLQHGLAELVAYLQLADDQFKKTVIDEEVIDIITWKRGATSGTTSGGGRETVKQARLPRVIFVR